MFAKVLNAELAKFPYSFEELRAENPYTAFNAARIEDNFYGTEAWLAGYRIEPVTELDKPEYDPATQVAELNSTPVLVGDEWQLGWTVRAMTAEEVTSATENKSTEMRALRNALLSESDWSQVADAPVNKAKWAEYRQSLRDVPAQPGFPWSVTWPALPQ